MPKNPAPWQKLARVNAHPRDARIEFDEPTHRYTIDGVCEGWTSCTTLIHQMFPHFDADTVIEKMMTSPKWPQNKMYGKTAEEIKKEWSDNGARASSLGSLLHLQCEMTYNEAYEEMDKELMKTTQWEYFMNFFKKHDKDYKMFRTEFEVFSEPHKLAGSIDAVFKKSDGTYAIYDWKFCNKMVMENRWEKGYGPCAHLDHTNYWHYSIQLNIYRWFLQTYYDMKITELALVLISPSNDNYKKYWVNDLSDVVEEMLECRLQAVQKGLKDPVDFSGYPENIRSPQKHH